MLTATLWFWTFCTSYLLHRNFFHTFILFYNNLSCRGVTEIAFPLKLFYICAFRFSFICFKILFAVYRVILFCYSLKQFLSDFFKVLQLSFRSFIIFPSFFDFLSFSLEACPFRLPPRHSKIHLLNNKNMSWEWSIRILEVHT